MRILDIDMDYFQSGIHCNSADGKNHLVDANIHAWSADDFIAFLTKQCGLSQDAKPKGRIVDYHKDTFFFIEELIRGGNLCCPFDLTHIDAHSDMGFSVNVEYHSFIESLQNVSRDSLNVGALFSTPEHRKYIDSGNYINALVLNRWVRYVDYVYHDKVGSELDVITKWFTVLEPCKLFRYSFSREAAEFDAYLRPISREDFFNDEQYDYVVFAKSPSFTVQATDKLVELAKKFVIEI